MLLSPVHTVLGILNNIPKVKVSLKRVSEILPKKEENATSLDEQNYDLKVKKLSFSYNKNRIFEDINLDIKENQKIALIGKNGKGKSTLTDLLCSIENPTSGEIFIGSTNIVEKNIKNISDYIVKMEQIPVMFDGTLKENLLLSNKNIEDEKIIDVLKLVKMYDWYKSLENGLDSRLIESGRNLSVGQKQRLSLARILLLKPKIVILDEFTSSIDKEDTKWFFENIDKLFSGMTVIVITHQLDMLDIFDFVYTIEDKKIKRS
ncbi:ABC transporter ATP-binding protein [Halarcobacter anaerophilus]|uniref:ABC transporter ATP-binding protein n=1 Tax=Halarcobacter anaerophilus TaxID=877500 RepID=UPI0030B82810